MEIMNNNQTTWSPRIINQLKHYLSNDLLELFRMEWDRILSDTGFYMIPYSEEGIERMKNAHFWHSIVEELSHHFPFEQLAIKTGLNATFLHNLASGSIANNCPISYEQGEKLLVIYREHRQQNSQEESVGDTQLVTNS